MGFSKEFNISQAKAKGDSISSKFEGAMKMVDLNNFEVGDQFTFPENYDGKVFTDAQFSTETRKCQYILVDCGENNNKKFYPSSLTKVVLPYELKNGNVVRMPNAPRGVANGSAAEEFRKHGSIEEGMAALAGKTVKITAITPVQTSNFNASNPGLRTSNVYTIDFVD